MPVTAKPRAAIRRATAPLPQPTSKTAGTPPAAVLRLSEALRAALANPVAIQRMTGAGVDPEVSTPEEAGTFIARESEKWGRVVREARIAVE